MGFFLNINKIIEKNKEEKPKSINGIQIPNISEKKPPKNKNTVLPISCKVKIVPKVFPSTDSWVISEIYVTIAGNVIKTVIPISSIIIIIIDMLVKYVIKILVIPIVKYDKNTTLFLPNLLLILP